MALSVSGNETTDTTSNCSKPANYAVSLSLRLHKLIESRLETRIEELEIALRDSQFRGSKSMVSGRGISYRETESSCICEHDKREEQPYRENFSSNNVVAHKIQAVEDGESGRKSVGHGKRSINKIWNRECDFLSHEDVIMEKDTPVTLVQDMPKIWDEERTSSFKSNEDSMSEDEGSDESEMLLIRHILEGRRSASSFNLKID